jgi:hypothetical protein
LEKFKAKLNWNDRQYSISHFWKNLDRD